MRTGPDSSYTSQRVLQTGESVTITGSSGKWYRVSYNDSTGYVFGTYLSTGSSSGSSGSTSEGERLVAEAKNYLGVSYVYGGTSPSGFDCSGFVYYVYRQCGYSITRTATSQNSDGTYVARENLQPGDIVIFYNSAKTAIGHCGMYIGNGQFIHASSGSGKVVISNLSDTYYNTHYYSARRIVG
jgi:cell wall-associated NlpC family hydrolase